MEKESIFLAKYVSINFANRMFYMPRVPAMIYIEGNKLTIDMADMDSYVIVDGLHCHYCLIYNSENDTVDTWLKDYSLDGTEVPFAQHFSFKLTENEFPFGVRDRRMVVPKRDYSEIVSAFIADTPNLDARLAKFLTAHPQVYDQVTFTDWVSLNNDIAAAEELGLDADFLAGHLPAALAKQLFTEVFED